MSKTIQRLITVKEKVKSILETKPEARESDEKLVSRFWYDEMIDMDKNPHTLTTKDFFFLLSEGRLTKPGIIERERRRAQLRHPELRGSNYGRRQQDAIETKFEIPHT